MAKKLVKRRRTTSSDDPLPGEVEAFESANVKRFTKFSYVSDPDVWICEARSEETGDAMLVTYDPKEKKYRFFSLDFVFCRENQE